MILGAKNPVLQFLQLLRGVALAADQCLLPDIVRGNLVPEGIGNLDAVPEDPVVLDPQCVDAGALPFSCLQIGQPLVAVRPSVRAFR